MRRRQITLAVQNYTGTSVLYEWENDGNPIVNINNELIISPVTVADIGAYSVMVTVDGCSANSDTIQVDVFEQPTTTIANVAPITCVEGSEELTLTALPTNGVAPYVYNWSGPNGFISTDSIATILNITSAASGNYTLQIIDANGCASEVASTEVDITDGIDEPILTTTGAVCEGGQITLAVQNYTGTSVLYEWEKDGNPIVNINNELIINPVTTTDIGEYSVMVTVDGCSANSDTIQVEVFEQPTTTIANVAPITCVNGSEELELIALPANGVAPYVYNWSGSNGFISTDSIATLTNITAAMSGTYTLQITDSNGCTSEMSSTEVDITDGIEEPILTTTGAVCEGGQITLAVQNYTGTSVLYEWEKDGNPIVNINNKLIINPITTADIGAYSVIVTVDGCSADSDTIQVDVFEQPTTSIQAVTSITCVEGSEELELIALPANGVAPYVYNWSGPNGFTSTDSIATILNITSAASGNYTLQITDSNGCTSEMASTEVDITDGIAEPILTTTGAVCEGGEITLAVQNYTGTSVLYSWKKDNNPIVNINNELIINPVTTADIGEYSVMVTVDGCTANSDTIQVEVFEQPTTTIANVAPITCVEGSEELTLTALPTNGVAPYVYNWSGSNGFISTDSIATILNITSAASGNYTLQITDANGCASEVASTEVDITDGIDEPILTTTGAVCEGGQITLAVQNYTGTSVLYEWEKDGNPIVNINNELIINPVTTTDIGEYSVMVTVDGCSANSDTIQVEVFEQPTTTIANVAPITCVNGSEELELIALPANGVAPYVYNWSGSNGFISTDSIATLTNITAAMSGTYTLQITDSNGCTSEMSSTEVDITDGIEEPILTTTGAVCEGGQITLAVQNYTGTSVLYEWEKDGNPIVNINNKLIINPITTADIGEYSVIVTVDGCSANSDTIMVDVFEQPTTSIQAVTPITCVDGSEELNIISLPANGVAPYVYNWSGPNGFISTDSIATILNITSAASGNYTLQITDSNGCTSEIASTEVDITDGLEEPILTNTGAICEGGQITLAVQNYTGTSILYSWEKDNNPIVNINNELIINPVTTADIGAYSVMVTVDGCTANSDTIQVEVFEQPTTTIANVAPITCVEGSEELTLTALPTNGVAPYVYNWSGSNGFISTDSIATILNITSAASGNYTLQITDANGCTSEVASTEVDITDGIDEPILTTTGAVCEGGQITLAVQNYTGTSVLYEWEKDGNPIININNGLIINPITTGDIGEYSVIVTVDGCSANSDTIMVDVFEQPTITIANVAPVTCVEGSEELELIALPANGVAPYVYNWSGPNGFISTDSIATLTNITAAMSGTYTLQITDSNGCTSEMSSTEVDITDGIEEPILTTTGAVCEGGQITLAVQNYTGTNVLYQWKKDGTPITNINNELIINPVTTADIGEYSVMVTVDGCTANSDTIQVEVFEQPTITIANVAPIICVDGSEELELIALPANGVAPYTYLWSGNGFTSTDSIATLTNITAAMSGTYTLQVTDANGCTSEIASTEVDITDGIAEPVITASNTICHGEEITLSIAPYTGNNVTYTWSTPNNNTTIGITGQNTNMIFINPVDSLTHPGTYSLEVTVDGCTARTDTFQLNILPPPTVNPSMNLSTICAGGSLQLMANATNAVSYEWSGPNNFTASVPNPSINDIGLLNNGQYGVTVTNASGCQAVGFIAVNTITLATEIPTITSNAPICEGEDLILTTSASGTNFDWIGPLGGSENILSNNPLLRTTNDTTIIPFGDAAYLPGAWSVRVRDVNSCVAESAPIEVVINEIPVAEAFNNGPICPDGSVQLLATGNSQSATRYEWRVVGNPIIISTEQNPIFNNISDTTQYELTVTANACIATKDTTTVIVWKSPAVAPSLTYTLSNDCSPSDLQLFANETVGSSNISSYEWTGPDNFSSTLQNPIIANAVEVNNGTYSLMVTAENGCTATGATEITVITSPASVPFITGNGPSCEGERILLEIAAYTGSSVVYEWSKNGVAIASSNNPQLIIDPVSISDTGNYTVEVLVDGCTLNSTTYRLDIYEQPDFILNNDVSTACSDGLSDLQFQAENITGALPLQYSWTGPNGFVSNEDTIVLNNVAEINSGVYNLKITDANGCESPIKSLTVTISEGIAEPILNSTGITCEGERTILSVPVYTGTFVTYEWYKDGVEIATNNNELIINPVTTADIGEYSVMVRVDGCSTNSDTLDLTIYEQPVATISTIAPLQCVDGMQDLMLTAEPSSGQTPYRYAWTGPNGFMSTDSIATVRNINNAFSGTYQLVVTDANGCISDAVSTSVDITNGLLQPVIEASNPVCHGGEFSLKVAPITGINVTYEWTTPNGVSTGVSSVNTNEIFINPVDSNLHIGNYAVKVTVDGCVIDSKLFSFKLLPIPTVNPTVNYTNICEGGTLELAANATNAVSYEWSGPNNFTSNLPSPNISNISLVNNGQYGVTVTNASGCTAVDFITVDSIRTTTEIPTITSNAPICEGEDLVLHTSASGVKFEWISPLGASVTTLQNNPELTTITESTTISFGNDPYLNGMWSVRVTDSTGCIIESEPIEIIINEIPVAEAFNNGPICPDGSVRLLATRNSQLETRFEWRSVGDTTIISTQQNPIFSNILDTTQYELTVIAEGCISPKDTTTVIVWEAPTAAPMTLYTLQTDCSPADLQLVANVTIGSAAIANYEWSGPNRFTSTLENPIIANATAANNGTYTLIIIDENGCTHTAAVEITNISDAVNVPFITASNFQCEGENVVLEIPVYTGSSVTYNWFKDGLLLNNNSHQFLINPASTADNGRYSVTVLVDGCTTNSDTLDIEVYEQPTVSIVDVALQTCVTGSEEVELIALPSGGVAPYTYRWSGNGFTATDSIATLINITAAMSGTYTLQITDANGCTSEIASTAVDITNGLEEPVINASNSICHGAEITLSIAPITGNNVTYTWSTPNNTTIGITGQNTNMIIINPIDSLTHPGTYSLEVTVDGCTAQSDTFQLNILPAPTVKPTVNFTNICEGGNLQLIANATDAVSYEWAGPNGFTSTLPNPVINNITRLDNGQYGITVTNNSGCTATNFITVDSITTAIELPTITTNSPICEGEDLVLSTSTTGTKFEWISPLGGSIGTLQNNPELTTTTNTTTIAAGSIPYVAGSWSLRVTDSTGCISEADPIEVIINPIPVAEAFNNGPICPNSSVQLLATGNPQLATRYEWRKIGDTTIIATEQNPIFNNLNDTTNYELTIIAANCFSAKDTTTVIVWEAPTTEPTTTYTLQADCSPEDLQLMANVTLGSGAIATYNWTGPNGFTSTLANPIISNATAANNGSYNLVITDINGCRGSGATAINNITNSANIPFVLATGPTCANERVVLQTSAYSGVDVTYLWRKDGTPILNNNNPQLIFNPVLPSDIGNYTVQVAVGNCILNSSAYELTIYEQPNFTLDNDIEVSCTNGLEGIEFQAENITGRLPLQYNWTGPNGFRSNEDTIKLRNIVAENTGVYTLSITDANGCISPAKSLAISITDGLEEPVLTQSGITCEGGEIALTIPVYNGSSVTYNWFKDGILLSNNSNQFLINPATTADNGRYSVTVVVDGCTTNSDTLDIKVYEQPTVTIANVVAQSCVTGSEELAMIALPSGGVVPYTYQWIGNGFTATDSIAMLTNITTAMSGTYTLQITDANGCVSEIASTNVDITDGLPEAILTQSGVACEGGEIIIDVPIYTGSAVTYNWFKDGVLLTNNNNQLILNPTTTADNGRYAVTIIVDGCSTNSDTLDIEVYEQPSVTIVDVAPQSCVTGSEELAMIALPNGGVAPYRYTWIGNGFTATDSIATLTNITAAMSGTYTLQITDANGCRSEIVSTNIDIDNGIAEPILTQSGVTCEGGEIILSTQNYTGNSVRYNWYKDGVLLNNINNQLILNPATVADDGRYTVSVIVNGCTANSDTLDIEIYDRPTVTLLSDINQTCTNGLQAFELYATNTTGVAPFLYQWSGPNGYTSNADTVLITNTNVNNAGVYTLTITDANGCQSFAQSVSVNISEGLDEPIIQSTGITCEDDAVTLNVQEYNGISVDYDWYKDGVLLNSINNTLIITPVKLSDIGKYTVTVSVDGCVANSDTFDLGLYAKPFAEIAFDAPQACSSISDDLDLSAIVVAGERPYRYDWRGPNNFFSSDSIATVVNITNENSGIYTLVVTDANGCVSDITSTAVDITEGLAEPVIMASDPGCQGESVSLSIIPYVGQNVQYIWHTPNDVIAGISGFNTNAIFINPLDSNIHQGAYSIEVVLDDCTIESDTFFLNTILPPTVNPTASANTICEGGSIRLRANATNANSFEWSGPNDFSANLPNPLITNITTQFNGEYIVTVTNSSGCTAVGIVLVDSILINEQVPSFVTNSPICEGEDLVFTSSSFGDKFEWIGPLGASVTTLDLAGLTTTNGETVIPPGHPAYLAGTWRLRLTDLAGCQAESEDLEIVINRIPIAEAFNEGPVCKGADVQLRASSQPATSNQQPVTRYEWRVAGDTSIISTEQNPLVLNIKESTRFELTVSALGCVAEKATTSVVVWEAPQVAPNAGYTLNDDCAPTDLQLFANVTSGADTIFNYLWTGPNDFTSTIANPTVPNATAEYNGTYTLVVTDGNGCQATGSTEITTILNPNAVPFITSNGPVCTTERAILEVNEYAGSDVSYTWIKDGLTIQNNNSPRLVIDPAQPRDAGDYYVSVNVDGCTIISSIYQLNIYEKPQITIDSIAPILCAIGTEELPLNANVTGGLAPYIFEWVGPNNFFSVSEDPILVNVNSRMDGSYTVFVTDANGCQSAAVTIEVDITESINQPILTTNGPICSDERLVLSTQLYQGTQVRYEWIKDSVIIGTGSTNEWTIFPVDTSDSGQYQVRIFVNECENISDSIEVIIYDKLSANPAHNGGLCGDDLQLFTNLVNRDSNTQYLFEWTGPYGFISNAENPIIANPAALNEGSYVVKITNENGCTSNFATTEVTLISTTLDQPFITYNGAICEGEQLVLSTLQLNGRTVNYEWLGPDSTSTTNGDYPNSPFLIIDQVKAINRGDYQVIISVDSCQTLTSAVVAVTIDAMPEFAISNSGVECVLANTDIQLFATPTDVNTAYTYEWVGPNNFFSTTQNPVLPNAQNALAGTYTVRVSNGGGCQASQSTVLDISRLPNRPIISANGALCEGENLILTAPFYAGTDVRYEWIGPNGSTLDSTYLDNPTLSLEGATIAANGDYQVRVIVDGCASLFSAPFAVNVNAGLTAIITSNSLACVETNNTLTLTSEVNGGQAPYTYEWIGPNGFNSVASAPVLANLVGNQSGTYTLKVADANGCISNVAEQFINIMTQPVTPELLLGANDFCEGEELILSTNNYQGDTVTFHWQINGDAIENYTTLEPTLFIAATNANQSGLVNVAVEVDGCLSQISPVKLLTINAVPEKPQLDSLIVACEGTEIQLTTSTVAMDYNWAGPNGFTANVQQPMIIGNALSQNSGIYRLSVIENGCESETASTEVVTRARPNRPSLVTAAQICEGEAIELNVPNPIAGNTYQWIAPSVSIDQFPTTQNEVGDTVLWTTNNSTIITNMENPNLYESGAWQVRVIDENACASELSLVKNIQINALPEVPLLSNSGPICEGETVALFSGNIADAKYEWFIVNTDVDPANFNLFSTSQDPTFSGLPAGKQQFFLTLTVNGCEATNGEFTEVEVREIPQVSLPLSQDGLCEGDTLKLDAPTIDNALYSWEGPNGFISYLEDPILVNTSEDNKGSYQLTVSKDGCTANTVSTQVQINRQPATPNVSHNSPVCEGTPIQLTTSNVSGGGNLVYEWVGPNGFTANVQNPLIESADSINGGEYMLSVGIDGCFSLPSSPIPLQIKPSPEQPIVSANASIIDPLCEGEILQLATDFDNEATYQWVGPNGFTSNLYNPFINDVTVAQGGKYQLTVIVKDCPSPISDIDIGVQVKPNAPIAGNNSPVCADGALMLNVANADSLVTYEWFRINTNEFVGEGAPLTVQGVTNQDVGAYYVIASIGNCASEVFDKQGAIVQAFTEVSIVTPTREIAYAGAEIFSCDPEVNISAIAPEIAVGSWRVVDPNNTAAIINPTQAATTVANLETGITELVWSLDNGVCGIVSTDTLSISYNVTPQAVNDTFNIGVNEVIDLGLIRNDDIRANDVNIYINSILALGETQRNFEDIQFANNLADSLSRFTYFAAENAVGTEIFEYEICNKECPDLCSTATAVIRIGENVDCEAPNLVTPNNDGFNDSFIVPCLFNNPGSSITIFNRWGDEIYRSDNYQNDWEGTYEDGLLPTGTYYYLLEVNNASGTVLNGYLFLQR